MKQRLASSTGPMASTETLLAYLREGKARAQATGRPILVSFAQPAQAPIAPLAAWAATERAGMHRTLWGSPSERFWLVGLGAVSAIEVNGPQSLRKVREAHHTLLDDAVIAGPPVRGVGPVSIGGFRFDHQAPKVALWEDFPDGLLLLPRLLVTCSGEDCWLTVNTMVSPNANLEEEAKKIGSQLQSLADYPGGEDGEAAPFYYQQAPGNPQAWLEWVRGALKDIHAGRLTKVVLARRLSIVSDREFSTSAVLDRLAITYPNCTLFAIAKGDRCFLGATPEVLAHLEAGALSLSCLAGTTQRGASAADDDRLAKRLLESTKDRHEHATVVEAVAKGLATVCPELQWGTIPTVTKLSTIQHLATHFRGRPRHQTHILEIVEALHPTPAVGGIPVRAALETIRRLEGDRGWYAAPVGWIDPAGEGEFNIAIRSALVTAHKATVFAGSGIVRGSDPQEELRETELKMQGLLTALTGSRREL